MSSLCTTWTTVHNLLRKSYSRIRLLELSWRRKSENVGYGSQLGALTAAQPGESTLGAGPGSDRRGPPAEAESPYCSPPQLEVGSRACAGAGPGSQARGSGRARFQPSGRQHAHERGNGPCSEELQDAKSTICNQSSASLSLYLSISLSLSLSLFLSLSLSEDPLTLSLSRSLARSSSISLFLSLAPSFSLFLSLSLSFSPSLSPAA